MTAGFCKEVLKIKCPYIVSYYLAGHLSSCTRPPLPPPHMSNRGTIHPVHKGGRQFSCSQWHKDMVGRFGRSWLRFNYNIKFAIVVAIAYRHVLEDYSVPMFVLQL